MGNFETFNRRKKCRGHDVEVNLFTSYTEDNPGKRFFRCPFREWDDCKYFEWLDDELPPRSKIAAVRVVRKKNILEAELKQRIEKDVVLEEKLKMLDDLLHLNEALVVEIFFCKNKF
ncbi:hypothetical protein ACS0TY_001280 [Phlomoides rotata]